MVLTSSCSGSVNEGGSWAVCALENKGSSSVLARGTNAPDAISKRSSAVNQQKWFHALSIKTKPGRAKNDSDGIGLM